MARRTKEDALATRNLILDTAELVFARRGVSRSSLHEIAQTAGLSRGAIYWHFKDKADLFEAMMQRVLLPMEKRAGNEVPATAADALQKLRTRYVDALRKIVDDPQVRRVFEIAIHKVEYVDELEAVRDRRRDAYRSQLVLIKQALTPLMKQRDRPRRLSARSAALGLHSLLEGLFQNWMLDPAAFDLVKVGTQLIDAYLAGLGLSTSKAPPLPISSGPVSA